MADKMFMALLNRVQMVNMERLGMKVSLHSSVHYLISAVIKATREAVNIPIDKTHDVYA